VEETGHGIAWWRRMARVRRFILALISSADNVSECSYRAGYSNGQQAARDCSLQLGIVPTQVRALHA